MVVMTMAKSVDEFVAKVKDLLKARSLSVEELCLMYSFKHGVSVNQELTKLGLAADLSAFLQNRTDILLDGNKVVHLGTDGDSAQLKPFDAINETKTIIREIIAEGQQPVDGNFVLVKTVCNKFLSKFNVSLSSVVSKRPLEFFIENSETFMMNGRTQITLKNMLPPSPTLRSLDTNKIINTITANLENTKKEFVDNTKKEFTPTQFGSWRKTFTPTNDGCSQQQHKADMFRAAFEGSIIRPPPGLTNNNSRWVNTNNKSKKNCGYHSGSTNASTDDSSASESDEKHAVDSMYYELHQKISSRSFNSRVAQNLTLLSDAISNVCFLDIATISKGGAAGMGTVINSCCDAKLIIYVNNLPQGKEGIWMPPMFRAMKAVLMSTLPNVLIPNGARVTEDGTSLRFTTRDNITVDLQFAPVFESHADALVALGNRPPSARKWFSPVFAKELTHFVSKQPGSVKVTIRLLKWWRGQQEWSCELTRPSDDIIHLIAIYSAMQTKPHDQKVAVANCMSLFAGFNNLRVFWSNYYKREHIWEPLLLQKPLLMDPVNPFSNVADPQVFDSRELSQKAANTHFFW